MVKKISTFLLFTFFMSAAQAEYNINECIDAKKSIYQCIDEFVTEALPDTDWCTISPVDKDDKLKGFFVITIKLNSEGKTFAQEAHFLKAGTSGKLVSRAQGTWRLDGRAIKVKYNSLVGDSSSVKFPTTVQMDFKDLTGNKLILYSRNDDKSLRFGPITFQKCSRFASAF